MKKRDYPVYAFAGLVALVMAFSGLMLSNCVANMDNMEVEFAPNPDFCTIHLREQLTKTPIFSEFLDEKDIPSLMMMLLEIPGVVSVSFHPYQVCIEKARMYTWDEILPQALKEISNLGKPMKTGYLPPANATF